MALVLSDASRPTPLSIAAGVPRRAGAAKSLPRQNGCPRSLQRRPARRRCIRRERTAAPPGAQGRNRVEDPPPRTHQHRARNDPRRQADRGTSTPSHTRRSSLRVRALQYTAHRRAVSPALQGRFPDTPTTYPAHDPAHRMSSVILTCGFCASPCARHRRHRCSAIRPPHDHGYPRSGHVS